MWKSLRRQRLGLIIAVAGLFGLAQSGPVVQFAHAQGAQEAALAQAAEQAEEALISASEIPASATTNASPEATIEAFHSALLGIMKDAEALGFEGRIERLDPLMSNIFDLDFMASKTVGSHWRKLSDADKARWTKVFARLTLANYAGRFTGFTGETFEMVGQEAAARDTQLILTKIVIPSEEDVEINYRLIERDGQWRVIDVYLDGTVSELALRRSEYSSALKRQGFEELLTSVETKIADLKAKGLIDG